MTTANRFFEVTLNNNFSFPAYILEAKNEKIALKKILKEAKFNQNKEVAIFEVDEKENVINGGFEYFTTL